MKKSIIYSGIALLTFTNVITVLAQQSFIKEDTWAQTAAVNKTTKHNTYNRMPFEKGNGNNSNKSVSSFEETIMVPVYGKTMEEIIAENNQIIESTILTEQYAQDNQLNITIDAFPINNEPEMVEKILQDRQIIEDPILNPIQPTVLTKSKKL